MDTNCFQILLDQMYQACDIERREMQSALNLHYAHEKGNSPVYQYFLHGGPNHIWKHYPVMRNFLREQKQILLPDFETYMELQGMFALSPKSRRIFRKAQEKLEYPDFNPSDQKLILYFITTWGGVWFARHFTYPDRVLMLLHQG